MRARRAVRGTLMRGTIHMVTARDYAFLRPALSRMIERFFHTGTPFGRALGDIEFDQVVAAGAELLEQAPRTRSELSALLAERWPDRDPDALGYAVLQLQPTVQVTPRGVWGESKRATWALAEQWIGAELERRPATEELVLRYLHAFGPASVMDIQAWSGLTRLREVVEPLRPRLRSFRDENGVELFDLPGAPLAEADRPAPVRFLPNYDNVTLGHADRSRIVPETERPTLFAGYSGNLGGLLVDGFFRGLWKREDEAAAAVLRVEVTRRLSKRDAAAVSAEGRRLLALLPGGADERDVRIAVPGSRFAASAARRRA